MNATEVRVAFLISRFECDPDRITEAIGVRPSAVSRRGELRGKGPRTVKHHVWQLRSPLDTLDLDEHVSWLLARLPSELQQLRECTQVWKTQLTVGIDMGTVNEGLALGQEQLARLAALGATIDIDMYCVG